MSDDVLPDRKAVEAKRRQEEQQQLRRDQITEESMQTLLRGIENIEQNDPAMADALREIGHILTGDDRFEPDSGQP
jgi:hypothetical protein